MQLLAQRSMYHGRVTPDLRFPIDRESIWSGASMFHRWLARKTAAMLWFRGASSYQFGGYDGALKRNYVLINAPVFQVMHWILRTAGYDCSPAMVMLRCGVDPSTKGALEGMLYVDRWDETEDFTGGK